MEFKQIQKKVSEWIDEFAPFIKNLVHDFDKECDQQNKTFDMIIDNWIKLLLDLKNENKRHIKYQSIQFQFKSL